MSEVTDLKASLSMELDNLKINQSSGHYNLSMAQRDSVNRLSLPRNNSMMTKDGSNLYAATKDNLSPQTDDKIMSGFMVVENKTMRENKENLQYNSRNFF